MRRKGDLKGVPTEESGKTQERLTRDQEGKEKIGRGKSAITNGRAKVNPVFETLL